MTTDFGALNFTDLQVERLRAVGVHNIEQIDEKVLSEIDGRISNGIRTRLEEWKMRDGVEIAPPEDANLVERLYLENQMTFGERIDAIRREVESIQKETKRGMDYSAVLFDTLLEKIRPIFIRWGVSWHSHKCEIHHCGVNEVGGMLAYAALMTYTFRFQCVEGALMGVPTPEWYRDVVVTTQALDAYDPQSDYPGGDKGPGKAHTYAQKYAVRSMLNLPAGDDPDFIPSASLSTRARAERERLVENLDHAIEACGLDPDSEIPRRIRQINEQFSRSIDTILDADDSVIVKMINYYEEKAGGK